MNISDTEKLKQKGISEALLQSQLQAFQHGFPFLKIKSAASIGNGITRVDQNDMPALHKIWDNYLQTDAKVVKFVPASGAASRMFKDLYAFIDADYSEPESTYEEKDFFEHIEKFAFYNDLNEMCKKNENADIQTLILNQEYKKIAENLLLPHGLNYGNLPKALLKFHSYGNKQRTPAEEQLAEGALYAANKLGEVNIHFTVSAEHRLPFEKHIVSSLPEMEKQYKSAFNVSFSEQKPSTDTIAVDEHNNPFRNTDGSLVFRPGGHGALIENLNDIDADVIFIKNIDNVVPDSLKNETVIYKKLIAGKLISIQKQCFDYIKILKNSNLDTKKISEIAEFIQNELCISDFEQTPDEMFRLLNRPIRVCGMVKNEGEPGGGPYITVNPDKTASLQILESSQIDMKNSVDLAKMKNSTHFNPVDLVCAVRDYNGHKYSLTDFIDKNTGFISEKSKNGKTLKALELPGLWNGAMSNWITVFVEVPVSTFNPVKTVNDLLRPQHQ